jgi:DNA-binding response OmpR family regulator
MELLARLEAVMRRTKRELPPDQIAFGDVKLDFRKYEATKAGAGLDLTQREFRILHYFLDHANSVVTREALLHHVWGYDPSAMTRTVDTHVARLRQKIETTPAEPKHLLTVHRVGYRFVR